MGAKHLVRPRSEERPWPKELEEGCWVLSVTVDTGEREDPTCMAETSLWQQCRRGQMKGDRKLLPGPRQNRMRPEEGSGCGEGEERRLCVPHVVLWIKQEWCMNSRGWLLHTGTANQFLMNSDCPQVQGNHSKGENWHKG